MLGSKGKALISFPLISTVSRDISPLRDRTDVLCRDCTKIKLYFKRSLLLELIFSLKANISK